MGTTAWWGDESEPTRNNLRFWSWIVWRILVKFVVWVLLPALGAYVALGLIRMFFVLIGDGAGLSYEPWLDAWWVHLIRMGH